MNPLFLNRFFARAAERGDQIALVDPAWGETTYRTLSEMSGQVYRCLLHRGVGVEDVVAIRMPRDARAIAAMLGVMRAGAAFTMLEETAPPERVAYILRDSGANLTIDPALWREIDDEPRRSPDAAYRNADPHDALMIVYTSGSTGRPKGVVHEYGYLTCALEAYRHQGRWLVDENDRFALVSRLDFIATPLSVFNMLYRGAAVHLLPLDTVQSASALSEYFMKNHIDGAFVSPALVRMLSGTNLGVRFLLMGGERADGIFAEGCRLFNAYSCSECGYVVSLCELKQPHPIAPIGAPRIPFRLVPQEGRDGISELCLQVPWSRGYRNLPEETEKKYGEGRWFYTGDLVRTRSDGSMLLLGRKDDMIKINGYRVEPAEIEAAARELFSLPWAVARAFETDGHIGICLFYTGHKTLDEATVNMRLRERLPYYMLPSACVRLDKIPLLPSGKLDRSALRPPERIISRGYIAPENDEERALCETFAQILKLERFGVTDDFYLFGGDSLRTVEALDACPLPGLRTDDILRGRTPRKIARLYARRSALEVRDAAQSNRDEMGKPHPLTVEQQYMLDYQASTPDRAPYDLCGLLRLSERLQPQRLCAALRAAVEAHPSLMSVIVPDADGVLRQHWQPESVPEIPCETLKEAELNRRKSELIRPLTVPGGTPWALRLLRTERADYVFYQLHHTAVDGTSAGILVDDVARAYRGEKLETDDYYLALLEREEQERSDFYEESRIYWHNLCDGTAWQIRPNEDTPNGANRFGSFTGEFTLPQEKLELLPQRCRLSKNALLATALALSIAAYNNARDVMVTWAYNGRRSARDFRTVGAFFRSIPLALHLDREMTLAALCAEVRDRLIGGVTYSCYPYAKIGACPVEDDKTMLLLQDGVRDFAHSAGVSVGRVTLTPVELPNPYAASYALLDFSVICDGPHADLFVEYNAGRYRQESIRRFAGMFVKAVDKLLNVTDEELHIEKLLRALSE